MDVRGRPDRSGVRSLKIGSRSVDLIEDIHRQHRRRVLKRAAQFIALVLALLAVGVAFKLMADRRARVQALDKAQQHFVGGTVSDVRSAVEVLGRSLESDPGHVATQAAHALMRAHLWTEFGSEEQEARDAVAALIEETPVGALAAAFIAFGEGELETAKSRLDAIDDVPDDPFFEAERLWLAGMLTAAMQADDEAALAEAISGLDALRESGHGGVAHRRVQALLLLLAGDDEKALAELSEARKASRSHMGLAADEAYYNAYLHQELAGVASVADQLLATPNAELSPRDRAHVLLARAVVHVRSGEAQEGLALLDEAWPGLAEWSAMARELALQTLLEAADDTRLESWLEQTSLPPERVETYRAWAKLVRGDVMRALEELASLPQNDPWVAYLQALALVEQRRFEEADPWAQRARKLLPGRTEIDVAQARIELRIADPKLALAKLSALAEEEPYAPRAWTGLGEGYLLQEDVDERKAKKAFEKAVDREAVPAEAMLQLAKLADARRKVDPEAERQALELMEGAAKANPHLPRYAEALALYAWELGYDARARELLSKLREAPGISAATLVTLAEIEIEERSDVAEIEALLERASELGARRLEVERLRARSLLKQGTKVDTAAAEKKLEALLEEHPADVETRVLYARALLAGYDRKAAEAALRRGFSTTPQEHHGRLHLAWAEIENRTGKRKTAAPRARSAWLKMLEEDRPARELLAAADLATRLWVRQQQNRVALTIAKQLTSRMAFHAEAWTIRAQTELGVSDASSARGSAERAIDLDKDNPRAHAILGHALLRFGYKDLARESYERAIELVAGTSDEKEYRDNLRRL
jgi:predicted Zn-dependent protease